LIEFVGHQQARKGGQLNREKVVSPAQEQFFSPWCLILYARREAGKAEIKPRVLKKATHQIASISHQWFNMLSRAAWSAPGSVFDRAFDTATGTGQQQPGGSAFVPFGNTPACQPKQGFL
jgi:hypothetical protein